MTTLALVTLVVNLIASLSSNTKTVLESPSKNSTFPAAAVLAAFAYTTLAVALESYKVKVQSAAEDA